MKKLLAVSVFALFVLGLASAADSPLYAKVVPVHKITSHQKGYKVNYVTNHGDLKTLYVPIEWFYPTSEFKTSDGFIRAELVKGSGQAYPYLQIFWKDGTFHHLRLFVRQDFRDPSWGVFDPAADFGAQFDPAKVPVLQF